MSKPVKKTSVTASFILKEPTIHLNSEISRNETIIVFRVVSGRKIQKKFSTGYKVNPKYWDKDKQRIRNVAAVSNSVQINIYLESLKNKFDKLIADKVMSDIPISKSVIKEVFDTVSNRKLVVNVEEEMTFFNYCDLFIENKKKTLPKTRGNKSQTVSVYKQAIKHFKAFQKDEGFKVDFDTIDLEFYYDFIDYMQKKTKDDGSHYSANTIGKHIKTMSTVLNAASNDGYNSNFKYKHPEFKVLKELTTAIFLTKEELQRILKLDLSGLPNHQKARDIFIIGCEIGQRISDYNRLSEFQVQHHKGEDYFVVNQQKTRNKVYCLITPVVRHIMNKRYGGHPPATMPEQHINKLIKVVGEMAKINDLITFERTEGKKKTQKKVPKYDLIATHTARRTYATLKYNAGVPVHDIMVLTGHKTEREFLRYIREDGKDITARIIDTQEIKDSFLQVV